MKRTVFFKNLQRYNRCLNAIVCICVTLFALSGCGDSGNSGDNGYVATYTITYDDNVVGETIDVPPARAGHAEGTITSLSSDIPERTGYTFAGWNTSADGTGTGYAAGATMTMGSADVILYAQWTTNPTYTLSYEDNVDGETIDVPTTSTGYVPGTVVAVSSAIPERTGYDFAGWNTAADGTGTGYAAGGTLTIGAADVTLYAQWTTDPTYTISYDDNVDGETIDVPPESTGYLPGTEAAVDSTIPVRSGYTFTGWNTEADGTGIAYTAGGTLTMGAADVTLYAQWTDTLTYSLTYDDNVSDETIGVPTDNTVYFEGSSASISTTVPTRTGYDFTGWNTAADGSADAYAAGASLTIGAADVILYAQWEAILYTITYDANVGFDTTSTVTGSPPVDGNTYILGDTVTVLGNSGGLQRISNTLDPDDEWYFVGWRIETDSGTVYRAGQTFELSASNTDVFPDGVPGNVTLYARWHNVDGNPGIVRVSYDGNGAESGSEPAPALDYVEDDTVTVLDNLGGYARSDAAFYGWTTNPIRGEGYSYRAGETFTANRDVTLYVVWGGAVTYDANVPAGEALAGGTVPAENTVYLPWQTTTVPGNTGNLTLTNDSGANYYFDGWTATDGSVYFEGDDLTIGETSVTLSARWLASGSAFPVNYRANGGSGELPAAIDYAVGATVVVDGIVDTDLQRDGYIFGGWTPVADDNSTLYTVGDTFAMGASPVDLYAYWQPRHTFTGTGDDNATALAMSGDYAIAGFRYRNERPDRTDAGEARVYTYGNGSWVKTLPALLVPEDAVGEETNEFGLSVAIHAGTRTSAIVGSDGAAYVFEYDGSSWNQVAKFTSGRSDIGASVAISDDFAVVGDDSNNKVFVIPYDATNDRWSGGEIEDRYGALRADVTRITSSSPLANSDDYFGGSVALSGTTLVVGAPSALVAGPVSAPEESLEGRVWTYSYDGGSWNVVAELVNPQKTEWYYSEDLFGDSVAISENKDIIVGAPNHKGDFSDTTLQAGSAYVYPYTGDASGDSWAAGIPLIALDKVRGYQFGYSVAISGNYALVGSPDDGASGGVRDDTPGSAYLFTTDDGGSTWTRGIKFPAPDGAAGPEEFGTAVAMADVSSTSGGYRAAAGALERLTITGETAAPGATYFWEGPHSQPPAARYPVTYTGNGNDGGDVPVDVNLYADGDLVTVPDNTGAMTLANHRFDGWTRDGDTTTVYAPGEAFVMGAAGTTLAAEWIRVATVTYDPNLPAGTSLDTGSVPGDDGIYDVGDSVRVASDNGMTVSGYRFTGWNGQADGQGTAYAGSFTIADDTTLYAQWLPVYTVTYDGNSNDAGTVPVDGNSYAAGEPVTVSANGGNLARSGYSFGGWNTAAGGGGTAYDASGSATFDMPASDVTLYARWLQIFGISYSDASGESSNLPQNGTYVENDASFTISTAVPVRDGYVFDGWYTDAGLGGTRYMPGDVYTINSDGDVGFYADWVQAGTLTATPSALGASYTVSFDDNDGNGTTQVPSQTVAVGDTAVPPASLPVRTGYDFNGWYSDPALTRAYSFDTAVTGDVTVYARWISQTVSYTVSFENDSQPSQTVFEGASAVDPGPLPDGIDGLGAPLYFIQWLDPREFVATPFDFNAPITADLTLTPQYGQSLRRTVSFDDNDGDTASNQIASQHVSDGKAATEPAAPPVKSGADFAGWYSDPGLTTPYDFSADVTSDITLYARWIDRWTEGDLATSTDNTDWYYFDATAGSEYEVAWDDSADGSFTYGGDVRVTAYRGDLASTIFAAIDNGYAANAQRITATVNERIYLRVEVNSGTADRYALRLTRKYEAGDTGPGGGLIFYVDDGTNGTDTGGNVIWTYLEAAPASYDSQHVWGPNTLTAGGRRSKAINGSNETALGTGYGNTMDFIDSEFEGPQIDSNVGTAPIYYAAQRAAVLSLFSSATGVLFDDWFLPASDTLSEMYANLYAADYDNDGAPDNIGEFVDTQNASFYWGSTEAADIACDQYCEPGQPFYANHAWSLDVGGSGFVGDGRWKDGNYYVRAVRRF